MKRHIYSNTDLDCSQYKDNYLKRRLNVRVRVNHLDGFRDYLKFVKKNPDELIEFLDTLTINVTQFFRDQNVFKVIGEEVLPELIYDKTNEGRKIIRIWSAGCASGEETYSIAIMFHEMLGERLDDFMLSVYGTDIDNESLKKAKKGEYVIEQLENMDKGGMNRYFYNEDDKYIVKDEIKDLVRFKKHNLIDDKMAAHYDIIFNRNVMIYFSREMQEKLLMNFYEALNNGGYLVIGKTEILTGAVKDMLIPINNRERIYRKEKRMKWS